jgi:hypothetical protein
VLKSWSADPIVGGCSWLTETSWSSAVEATARGGVRWTWKSDLKPFRKIPDASEADGHTLIVVLLFRAPRHHSQSSLGWRGVHWLVDVGEFR